MSGIVVHEVLGVLRKLHSTPNAGLGQSALHFMQIWADDHSPASVAKIQISILNNLDSASHVISASSLTDEAKSGLMYTVSQLREAFSAGNVNNALQSYFPALDPAITNFAILSSYAGIVFPEAAKDAAEVLIGELQQLIVDMDQYNLSTAMAAVLKRQINALVAMLRNAEAFGFDAALSAYYDLLLNVRKMDRDGTEVSEPAKKPLWDKVKSLEDKIKRAGDLVESGGKLAPFAGGAMRLLGLG